MTDSLTVAVIGSRSYVGSHLCGALESAGHDVVALTRETFDVTDHDAALPKPVDVAIFLAQDRNYTSLNTPALGVFDVNTVGVLNAAIKARDAGARGFLFTSTGNVYAPSFEAHSEDEELARSDIYSTSKVFAEQILDLAAGDLTICRPRLFGAYGPNQEIGLMAGLANRIRSAQPVTAQPRIAGVADGGFTASLTHVDDIAAGLVELAELSVGGGVPYAVNLAASEPTTITDLAHRIGVALGVDVDIQTADGVRPFDLIADTSRMSSLLSTSFRSTATGIADALQA